jgi:hypothetical protein
MPSSWTLRLFQGEKASGTSDLGDAPASFRFGEVELVLRDLESRSEVRIPGSVMQEAGTNPPDASMAEPTKGNRIANLSVDDLSRTFKFDRVITLAPARYAVEAVRGVVFDGRGARPVTLSLPLPNPLESADEGPLVVDVKQGAVGIVGRLAFETVVGIKDSRWVSETRGENLEGGRIAELVIARDLGWLDGDGSLRSSKELFKANPFVGDLRGSVVMAPASQARNGRSGLVPVGFGIEAPCDLEADLKLVWKADGETKEYVSLLNVRSKPSEAGKSAQSESDHCDPVTGRKTVHLTLFMRPYNWLLQASEIIDAAAPSSGSKIRALSPPSEALREHYGVDSVAGFVMGSISRELQIRRRIYLPLSELRGAENQVYYAGRFAVAPVETAESKSAQRTWSIVLRKSFETEILTRVYGVSRLWNPYSGAAIDQLGKAGKVEANLQVSSDALKSEKLNPYVAKMRKDLTEAFAKCVQQHEEGDPLVVARASVRFQIRSKQRSATLESNSVDPSGGTDGLAACFRKEFDAFRFPNPVPASFQAEMVLDIK